MTINIRTFLLLCALVCFLLKAFGVGIHRVDFMNLGFAFVVASFLFG